MRIDLAAEIWRVGRGRSDSEFGEQLRPTQRGKIDCRPRPPNADETQFPRILHGPISHVRRIAFHGAIRGVVVGLRAEYDTCRLCVVQKPRRKLPFLGPWQMIHSGIIAVKTLSTKHQRGTPARRWRTTDGAEKKGSSAKRCLINVIGAIPKPDVEVAENHVDE